MTIYIAGPMTGLPDMNFPAFHAAAEKLRADGFDVVNPAEINPDPETAWTDCMRRDIVALMDCDSILMLPGWPTSRGASLEFRIAFDLGMTVYYGIEDAMLREVAA
ncbi:DUF4406 domain-containing protein [Castellaniella sp. WN]